MQVFTILPLPDMSQWQRCLRNRLDVLDLGELIFFGVCAGGGGTSLVESTFRGLSCVHLSEEGDRPVWLLSPSRVFSVKSFYNALTV